MPRLGCLVAAFALTTALAPAQPVTRADTKPGLTFTAAGAGGSVSRLDPGVALALDPGEAAHPRLADDRTFTWAGYLNVVLPGKYKFDAVLLGKLAVTVGGKTVLSGEAAGSDLAGAKTVAGPEVDLTPGFLPISVTLDRTGPAVRLELIWKGPGFQPEPVPYFFFRHRPQDRPAGYAADLARDHGRFLFEELSCVRCHKPTSTDAMAKTLVERSGPDLSEIGKRVNGGWLDAWLAAPKKLRPYTAMPKMFADDAAGAAERYAVAAYLASLGKTPDGPGPKADAKNVENGQRLYVAAGCAACHGDKVDAAPTAKKLADDEDEKPAAKPEDTLYSVGTPGPQGYYRLGAVGSKFNVISLARFLENPQATNPHGRMPGMALTPAEARDLAVFLVRATDSNIPKQLPPAPAEKTSEEWRALGQQLVAAKGCVNCHALKDAVPSAAPPGLAAIRSAGKAGCLADAPDAKKVPAYALTADQRAALSEFLADGLTGPGSLAPNFQARVALKRFNCLNCHSRDGEGGVTDALTAVMKNYETAENAEDLLPPRLSGVGHKLRTPWFHEVLTKAGRARPWMGLRMPQYGEASVGFLSHALPKLEGTVPSDAVGTVAVTPEAIDAGRTLAGKTATGFGCIACHDISGIRGGGTRGPDLATINRRLRLDWYGRWMHQPQRIAPGTKMPQNFIDGKSLLTGVLNGNADAQIEALWAYLSLGPGLPLPAGIEPPNQGIVVPVKDRTEVMRAFLPDGAGTKGVAVGYPGGVSVAFDAAACRVAYAWAGNFVDAGPAWTNRGGGPVNLLGAKFWTAPAGHPWAVTDGAVPDFAKRAADPAYGHLPDDDNYIGPRYVHFRGYSLDAGGNPTFRYTFDAPGQSVLTVTEKPAPLSAKVATGLSRAFTADVPAGKTAWLLAATASAEPRVSGTRVVAPQPGGRAVVLDLTGPATWQAVRAGDVWQVLAKLPAATGPALTVNLWALPRDDEQLVKALK